MLKWVNFLEPFSAFMRGGGHRVKEEIKWRQKVGNLTKCKYFSRAYVGQHLNCEPAKSSRHNIYSHSCFMLSNHVSYTQHICFWLCLTKRDIRQQHFRLSKNPGSESGVCVCMYVLITIVKIDYNLFSMIHEELGEILFAIFIILNASIYVSVRMYVCMFILSELFVVLLLLFRRKMCERLYATMVHWNSYHSLKLPNCEIRNHTILFHNSINTLNGDNQILFSSSSAWFWCGFQVVCVQMTLKCVYRGLFRYFTCLEKR